MESGEITDAQLNSSSNMGSLSVASNSRLNLQLMSPLGVAMGVWYALQQSEEYWLQVDFVTLHVISAVSHTYSRWYSLRKLFDCPIWGFWGRKKKKPTYQWSRRWQEMTRPIYYLLGKTGCLTVVVNGMRRILHGNFQEDSLVPFSRLSRGRQDTRRSKVKGL